MRSLLVLLLVVALAIAPVTATETVDQSVSRRYQNVITKARAHTLRSADLENLIVALDLRNRDAARRNIDRDLEATLRGRKAELATHIITPVEAAKIHVMHPELSEQELLASNKEDRGRQIDQFLARGGIRTMWRDELVRLRQQSQRIALLEGQPTFRPAAYDVEANIIRDVNYDGFYDAPVASMDPCVELGIVTALMAFLCFITGGIVDQIVNPACWATFTFGVLAAICPAL